MPAVLKSKKIKFSVEVFSVMRASGSLPAQHVRSLNPSDPQAQPECCCRAEVSYYDNYPSSNQERLNFANRSQQVICYEWRDYLQGALSSLPVINDGSKVHAAPGQTETENELESFGSHLRKCDFLQNEANKSFVMY